MDHKRTFRLPQRIHLLEYPDCYVPVHDGFGRWCIRTFLPLSVLGNTKLLPEITVETGLVIGFCIAYDRNRMKPTVTIVAPFLIIEIQPRRK